MSNETQPHFVIAQGFTKEHERVLTRYLQDDRRFTTDTWRVLYKAIELLDRAEVQIGKVRSTFRQLYNQFIDQGFADEYIEQLVLLPDVVTQGPTLTATFARRIALTLEQAQLLSKNSPQSYLLFAYCVYWWQSFARGYAFEVEIKRDLEASQIAFMMHDIRSRAERYSQADLIVFNLLGDIKTSTYFLHESSDNPLSNDFYITRLYEQGRNRTLVVFQKPFAWRRIGGPTAIPGDLEHIWNLLPQPVQLEQANTVLIVVDYVTWKDLVRRTQGNPGASND